MNTSTVKNIIFDKDINKVLDSFAKGVVSIFTNDLIGLYLTGSLSFGNFNPGSSDIDLVVILKKSVSADKLKQVKKLHQQVEKQNKKWVKRIECSYLLVDLLQYILPPKTPRPYYGEGILYPKAPYGNEWLINNYLLYNHGIALLGPDFKKLIKPIDISDVKKACIRDLFKEWKPKITDPNYLDNSHYQSYVVLNLCRILYTVMCNSLSSKKTSASWVKKEFKQWKDLIQTAENWQYGKDMNLKEETIEFIQFVIKKLHQTNSLNFG